MKTVESSLVANEIRFFSSTAIPFGQLTNEHYSSPHRHKVHVSDQSRRCRSLDMALGRFGHHAIGVS